MRKIAYKLFEEILPKQALRPECLNIFCEHRDPDMPKSIQG